jgi:hypothetical protein
MRRFVQIAIVAVALAAATFALAGPPLASADQQAAASVVSVDRVAPPRRMVIHRHFRPWSKPTPGQVREIIRSEARRWRISASGLARRVGCESRFHWWAGNGSFQGVLQFSWGTFSRGLHTIRDRRVVFVRERVRRMHEWRVVHYSDGRIARKRGRPFKQRIAYIYKGRLPHRPSVTNAWAQLRIGAQAIRGISAVHNSEWSCGA